MAYHLGKLRPCDKPPYTCPYGATNYKDCGRLCDQSENTDLYKDLRMEQEEQM